MEVVHLTYPIGPADRMGIIELLQQEWARTDVDWLQSMRGAYSRTLRTQVLWQGLTVMGWGQPRLPLHATAPRSGWWKT